MPPISNFEEDSPVSRWADSTAKMSELKSVTDPQPPAGGDRSLEYWGNTTADIDGMLGGVPAVSGFSSINRVDLQGSRNFLAKLGIGLKNGRRSVGSVLEGGAGCVPGP